MNSFKEDKTNWKYILIVAILAVIVGGGILGWIEYQQTEIPPTNPLPKPPLGNENTTNWKSYSNSHYNIELKYPPYWQLKEKAAYAHRYEGKDGFFQISAVSGDKLSIDKVCKNEAYHKLKPYGSEPKIEKLKIDNQDACLIIPSADQVKAMKNQSALIIHYPQPIQISGETYNYFILWADKNHINEFAKTLKFIRDETDNWEVYRNEEYGYEFKYPQDYFLKEVLGWDGTPTGTLLLRKTEAKETEWLIEVFVKKDIIDPLYDTSKMSFIEFAVDRTRAHCAADGPMGSIHCTDVISQEKFMNDQGIEGYKIYITEVTERYQKGKTVTSKRTKGPIFAFDISKQTDLARGIFFQLTELGEESFEKENFLKTLNQIVSTFKFTKGGTTLEENRFIEDDKTANWKTYRNEEYGFEIKYPKGNQCEFSEIKEGSFLFGRIELNVTNSKGLNLDDYVEKFIADNDLTIETIETTSVANREGIKLTYRFGGTNRYGEVTFVKNNGNIYAIGYTGGTFLCNEPEIFSKMLSTFRFLE